MKGSRVCWRTHLGKQYHDDHGVMKTSSGEVTLTMRLPPPCFTVSVMNSASVLLPNAGNASTPCKFFMVLFLLNVQNQTN